MKPECHFMLRVESKKKESFLTFYIFSVLDSNDKIGVYWGWSLLPEYVEGLRVTNKEVKRQLYQDLLDSSFLSHVIMQLKPPIEDLMSNIALNIEEIRAQKVIMNDGLTKRSVI